jgi:hypothetical protein
MKIKLTESQMKQLLQVIESSTGGEQMTCECGWSWNTNESDESDKYVCHKCGKDNEK